MYDQTDLQIIDELQKNGRMTMKELGSKVHLTGQATSSRVAKLEKDGVIQKYTIDINKKKLGYLVHTFINIYIKETQHQAYLTFIQTQKQYVIQNYKISGESCYLLECRFPSHQEVDSFLDKIITHANYKLSIVIR